METPNEPFYPDGLTAERIEALLIEAQALWSASPHMTSALLDGSAAERRRRRMSQREVRAAVRTLPATAGPSVTGSEVA